MATNLTPKQEAFVQAYLTTGNASEAYRVAGIAQSGAGRFYTYFLIDPRDQQIFYVGKGKGNRLHQHVVNVNAGRFDNPAKCKRILDITESGHTVIERHFSWHDNGMDALIAERVMIERFPNLTNAVRGVVPFIERELMKIEYFLKWVIPYERWVERARPDQIASATHHAGSPRKFYDMIVSEMNGYIPCMLALKK